LAVVVEGKQGRVYLPMNNMELLLEQAFQYLSIPAIRKEIPTEPARGTFASNAQGRIYGFKAFADYFTPRQLVALTTFSALIQEARDKVLSNASITGLPVDGISLNDGGTGANAYSDAVATYLAMAVDRLADRNSTICSWDVTRDSTRNTFARQAIPMVWDFAEANPLSESTGNFYGAIAWVAEVVEASSCNAPGKAQQCDATTSIDKIAHPLISTDPPY